MKLYLEYLAVTIFAIFIGSQVTEGALLVPFWQSLSSSEFYEYYNQFGPGIGRFYTVLTMLAAVIPLVYSIYYKKKNASSFKFAVISTIFAILFVSSFCLYFKGTNELFYQGAFSKEALKKELVTWSYWHWSRILIEIISLSFLIFAFIKDRKITD